MTGIVRRAAVAAVLLAAPIGLGGGQAFAAPNAGTVGARAELRTLATPSGPAAAGPLLFSAPPAAKLASAPPAATSPPSAAAKPASTEPASTKLASTKPASAKSTKPTKSAKSVSTKPAKPAPAKGTSSGSSTGFSAVESQVIALTNAARAAHGCAPLRADARLGAAARAHSADMAAHGYFSHVSPNGATFSSRAAAAGYSAAMGENIAWGWPNPTVVMQQWMNSPPHRANIEKCSAVAIGVGVAHRADGTLFWTQVFGRV